MRLPNASQARVAREKITGYLLAENPESGRGKPGFFVRFGFSAENWQTLADALLEVGREYDVVEIEETQFGVQYAVEGWIHTPDERNPYIRVIWQIDNGNDYPRLITAYPKRRRIGGENVRGAG